MSAKHTPGPWFIWKELAMQREGCDPDEIEDALLHEGDHGIYAGDPDTCTRGKLRGHSAHIFDLDADYFDFDDDEATCRETALANARLIAAAPELLAALIELNSASAHGFLYDDPARVRARAAIAKATGGRP